MNSLKKAPVWVGYALIQNPDKPKPDKIPINPHRLTGAQSNNQKTWASYETACGCIGKLATVAQPRKDGTVQVTGEVQGVGFMFQDGICGIDIDDVQEGREQTALEIIHHMDSYCELSPSGNGYHILFRCDPSQLPDNYSAAYYQKNTRHGIECYLSGRTNRYFTFTGEHVNDREIEERTPQLLSFLEKYMKKPPQRANDNGGQAIAPKPMDLDIHSILEKARQAKNGKLFSALFDQGDYSMYTKPDQTPDHSSGDIALCNLIAFYFGGDFHAIDRVFRMSALYRPKWEREDYRTNTINKAIESCNGEFYKAPGRPKGKAAPARPSRWPGALYFNPFKTPQSQKRYTLSDIGAGCLFADTYKQTSRFVPEARMWYVFDGRVWKPDIGGVVVAQQAKQLVDHMFDCRHYIQDDQQREAWVKFTTSRMRKNAREAMLSDASSEYPVSILTFDKDPYVFNCQNCTLDLRTFTQRKHRADDFLSKISNVVFDKDAICERWTRFIDEIMCGNQQTARFLQKAMGYALVGDTAEECFFILYGSTTRNGKGTLCETALHMMGGYGRTAQPETIAQKQNTHGGAPSEDVARLKGARFVNMSEPDKGLRLNASLVKQLTGGDTVTARFLNQNSFEFRPEFKLYINTNHLPRVSDDSVFASGRVKLIPFERHFEESEQDKGLKAFFKSPENISAIFNWFAQGLRWMQHEGLEQPKAVKDATAQYRGESDTVTLFIKECLTPCPGGKIKAKNVYCEYERWCDESGLRPRAHSDLVRTLRTRGMIRRDNKLGNIVFDYMLANQISFSQHHTGEEDG